jgi:hypothetical protein
MSCSCVYSSEVFGHLKAGYHAEIKESDRAGRNIDTERKEEGAHTSSHNIAMHKPKEKI